jgi:GNAT superfamily N-acetyltransferase
VSPAQLATRPVATADLDDLEQLFASERNAHHCWCMAFCSSRARFAVGWVTGDNRDRFAAMAASGTAPMGILASMAGEPAGWCACGPRSRYPAAIHGRFALLRERDRAEDDVVWLLPCLFVAPGHRGQGVTHTLVRAAVDLARRERASALEAWPSSGPDRRPADAFLGQQEVFEAVGFRCVARPRPDRVVMRLDLQGGAEA